MKIHHLNCATFCPFGGHFMDGMTPGIGSARLVCHCLLIEGPNGLILIDTGLGTKEVEHPDDHFSSFHKYVLRPALRKEETAHFQIKALGFHPADVKHIILTHLDFDHAGGISDFPNAEVHVMHAEVDASKKRNTFVTKQRYSPTQLKNSQHWNTYYPEGERWFGFQSVRDLEGIPPEILFVPLVGHTEGHAGVAIQTDRGWLLYAGDAYFYRGEMEQKYNCPSGLRAYQRYMEADRSKRLMNQQRLRDLNRVHSQDIIIFSAHDAIEYLSLKEGLPHYLYNQDFIARDSDDLAGLGLS